MTKILLDFSGQLCSFVILIVCQLWDNFTHCLESDGTACLQGAAEKSGPLNFFAVFSATVWDFNTKFYSFIY